MSNDYLAEAKDWLEHVKKMSVDHANDEFYQKRLKTLEWLIQQAEKTKKYEHALEEIAYSEDGDYISYGDMCTELARKILI